MLPAYTALLLLVTVAVVYLIWYNIKLGRQVKRAELFQQDWQTFQALHMQQLQEASHDIRGPLAAAMGYVDLLLEDRVKKPEDRQRCLSNARSSLNKLHEILELKLDQPIKDFKSFVHF